MPDGVTAAIAVIILLLASATGLVIMLNFKQGSSAAAETPAEPVTALTAPVPASPGSSPGLAPLPFQPVMPMPVTPPGGAPVPAVDHDTVPEQQQSAVEQHVQQPPSDTAAHSRPASGGVATHSDGDRESSAANRGQVQDRDSDNYADHDSNSDGDRHGNQHHSTESGEGRSGQSDQSSDSEQESGSGLLDGLTGLVGHSLLGG
jgi:type IV secretory pathway VirB10-like protein